MEIQGQYIPRRLAGLKPPTKGLWWKGNLALLDNPKMVAIVGSRRMSRYGLQALNWLVPRFVAAGYTTVSGFMYGIDTEVYRLTRENGGSTIAVLGYGIERDEVEVDSKILLLSEYPGQTKGQVWTFPQRNRIVVALAEMVVIVEAGVKSGSLNSASWARRMEKSVLAVPGSIFSSTSLGTNGLIASGRAVALTQDKLSHMLGNNEQEIYPAKRREDWHKSRLSASESTLVALLKLQGPRSVNELARGVGMPVGEVGAMLTSLLLRGVVMEERGMWGVL